MLESVYLWPDVPTVALDLETTGINRERDRIIQYGIFGTTGSVKGCISITAVVNAETSTGRDPRNIPDVKPQDITHARPLREGHLDVLYNSLHKHVVIMHNAAHDWTFIKNEFKRNQRSAPEPLACVCTYSWARRAKIQGLLTLGELCTRFKVDLKTAHNAWHDARATFYLFIIWINDPKMYLTCPVSNWKHCSMYFPPTDWIYFPKDVFRHRTMINLTQYKRAA